MPMKKSSALRPLSLRRAGLPPASIAGRSALALSVSALMIAPAVSAEEEALQLDTLQIEERTIDTNPYAEADAPYKAKVSGDARHVKPLAETPQTISVLTQTQIQDSGRSDLREILEGQPGITLGTGENGNAFGDRYVIRGHEARSDVFVDGLRDPGMTIRESFAVEQLEVTKGPSSTFAGRGSTGGAINSVTKQASTEYDFTKLQGGLGTDAYHRYTVDANKKISDDIAVRANLLEASEDVPDRDGADRQRQGAALSAAFQVTDKLNVVTDYYHLQAHDNPDLGTYIKPNGGEPVKDIPTYVQDQDFLESTVDTATVRVGYDFTDDFRVQNAVRYGETDNGYVVTGARGGVRDASDPLAPGADTISLSTHQGWQEVEYFVDQLNFYFDTSIAGQRHQFLFGTEFSDLKVLNGVYNVENTGATTCIMPGRGSNPAAGGYCIIDENGGFITGIHNLMDRVISKGDYDSNYNVETISWSVMDTIDLTEQLSLFLGVRYDDFDYTNTVVGREETNYFSYSDDLWNEHIGVVHDITEQGNVYLTYSTSSEINGGESDVGGSCGYGGLCGDSQQVDDSKPESVENIELGTKWNLFDEKLLASAAIFQITKDDVMESVGDDYASLGTLNTGKNRVEGIELGLSGNITRKLSAQIGLAMMDSEVLDSYDETGEGHVLSNFADDSATMQLRYQLNDQISFGGAATYSSEMYAGQPDTAASYNTDINDYSFEVPSYTTYDLFAQYDFTEKLQARLNVLNVTDEDYYLATYRSGAFTYIGDARRAYLTLAYEM